MPATLPAHAAAVLPLFRFRRLHPTALVAGACAPDLAYLVGRYGSFLHSVPGIIAGCVPLGLLVLVWAEALVLPVLRETLPTRGGVEWARFARSRGLPLGLAGWAVAAASVAAGAATHVLWDGFTHRRQWPARVLYPDVVLDLGGEPMGLAHFLQWASSIAGTLVVLGWMLGQYAALPPARATSPRELPRIATLVLLAAAAGAILRLPEASLWLCFWGGASGAVVGLTVACTLLRIAPREGRRGLASIRPPRPSSGTHRE